MDEYPIKPGMKLRPIKRKHIQEIRKYQNSTELLIRKLSFQRLVRDTTSIISEQDFRFQSQALAGFHQASEAFLTEFFENVNACAFHAKRMTIKPEDFKLVMALRGRTT